MAVKNEAGDLVLFIGHHILVQEAFEGHIGQHHLGAHAFLVVGGRHPGQHVARSEGRRLGQDFAQGAVGIHACRLCYRNVLGRNMAISGKSITSTSPTSIIMTIGTMEA